MLFYDITFETLLSIHGIILTDDNSLYGSHAAVLITKQSTLIQSNKTLLLSLHGALLNLYIFHSPTNALFIKLGKVQIYMKIHIIIALTCFGLRSSSGSLYRAWLELHFC